MDQKLIMKQKLVELLNKATAKFRFDAWENTDKIADDLLDNGVIVTPCVAMVEQFIKDGKFDRQRTAHNGRFAVVYKDKKKSSYLLIDVTEQFYNTEKAEERIIDLIEGIEVGC